MADVEHRTVAEEEADMRLDRWFKRHFPAIGHSRLQKLLRQGQIRVDGRRARGNQRLTSGQDIRVPPPVKDPALGTDGTARAPRVRDADIADLKARVLSKDASVLVIDKPHGMAVQGGTKQDRHLDAMLDYLRFDGDETPRLVHRLDKDTSGCLVLARSQAVANELGKAFRGRTADKVYWAITVGVPVPKEGRIELPLRKQPGKWGERVGPDWDDGKRAVTDYRVLDRAGRRAAIVELIPRTGRTHQLRAHASFALERPILCDGKYGGKDAYLDGVAHPEQLHLHARRIVMDHPEGGTLDVTAPLPAYWRATLDALGFPDPEG